MEETRLVGSAAAATNQRCVPLLWNTPPQEQTSASILTQPSSLPVVSHPSFPISLSSTHTRHRSSLINIHYSLCLRFQSFPSPPSPASSPQPFVRRRVLHSTSRDFTSSCSSSRFCTFENWPLGNYRIDLVFDPVLSTSIKLSSIRFDIKLKGFCLDQRTKLRQWLKSSLTLRQSLSAPSTILLVA